MPMAIGVVIALTCALVIWMVRDSAGHEALQQCFVCHERLGFFTRLWSAARRRPLTYPLEAPGGLLVEEPVPALCRECRRKARTLRRSASH